MPLEGVVEDHGDRLRAKVGGETVITCILLEREGCRMYNSTRLGDFSCTSRAGKRQSEESALFVHSSSLDGCFLYFVLWMESMHACVVFFQRAARTEKPKRGVFTADILSLVADAGEFLCTPTSAREDEAA